MRIYLEKLFSTDEESSESKNRKKALLPILGGGIAGSIGGGFAGDIGINNRVPEFYDKKKNKLPPRLSEDELRGWEQFIKREDRRRIPFIIGGTLVGAGIGYGLKKAIEKHKENRNNNSFDK